MYSTRAKSCQMQGKPFQKYKKSYTTIKKIKLKRVTKHSFIATWNNIFLSLTHNQKLAHKNHTYWLREINTHDPKRTNHFILLAMLCKAFIKQRFMHVFMHTNNLVDKSHTCSSR